MGHRRASQWRAQTSIASDCLYAFATTAASGSRTLGEEYSELLALSSASLKQPGQLPRAMAVFLGLQRLVEVNRLLPAADRRHRGSMHAQFSIE